MNGLDLDFHFTDKCFPYMALSMQGCLNKSVHHVFWQTWTPFNTDIPGLDLQDHFVFILISVNKFYLSWLVLMSQICWGSFYIQLCYGGKCGMIFKMSQGPCRWSLLFFWVHQVHEYAVDFKYQHAYCDDVSISAVRLTLLQFFIFLQVCYFLPRFQSTILILKIGHSKQNQWLCMEICL